MDTGKDARKIIKLGEIFVDGLPRKDHKYPVGLMDVIEIPKMNQFYRVIVSSKGLELLKIQKKDANKKICRINKKTLVKEGQVQLGLHDGKNIIIKVKDPKKPKEDVYKTGDSLLIEVPSQKILDHMKMEKANTVIITGGQNRGNIAKIKEVIIRRSREPNKVVCETKEKEFEGIKDYIFVIGKTKPIIDIKGN